MSLIRNETININGKRYRLDESDDESPPRDDGKDEGSTLSDRDDREVQTQDEEDRPNQEHLLHALDRAQFQREFPKRGGVPSKPIVQLDLEDKPVREWASMRSVMRGMPMSEYVLSRCVKGVQFSAEGFRWRYRDPATHEPFAEEWTARREDHERLKRQCVEDGNRASPTVTITITASQEEDRGYESDTDETVFCPQVDPDGLCLGDHPKRCLDALFAVFPNCGCTFPHNAHCAVCWVKSIEQLPKGHGPKCWKCNREHDPKSSVLRIT